MPLTRLDNLLSSKTGKYLYVSPDDYNASDALDNRGTSPTRPFLTIQRAFLEVARFSYVPGGNSNDRFDQFSIMLSPGTHYIDNRPGDGSASTINAFNYANGEWNDNSILDLGDKDNILYKFNSTEGGAIIPRGTSLVGMDLRRTQIKPLYVPDPADKDIPRTSLFQVTGGCYFWQFTIMDGDLSTNSPLYNTTSQFGEVYSQPNGNPVTGVGMAIPNYSHHKITNFIFATKNELGLLYQKVAKAFSLYQPTIDDPGEFGFRIQENRIVGPLSDSILIEKIKITNLTGTNTGKADITVSTKINHNFFAGQFVALTGLNAGNDKLNGVFPVKGFGSTNPAKEFTFEVPYTATGLGLVDNAEYTESTAIKLSKDGANAQVQAEVDSVESASPYVFNVSIRSTWGICGIWADGSRASGFKSMVIAQYTGVSLQKDDRAFIRYDEFSNTWNQANLQDAFSTTPYHIDGTAYWKDDWRNFHVRASDDAFIQCVSIFAVGFADHFLMESGGDMSITNSNSNFGNTSLHTIGYKPYSFNQDKGGYIDSIIPPKKLNSNIQDIKNYYTLNVSLSNDDSNPNRLYYGIDETSNPDDRPAASIEGYKIGAKSGERLYVKLDAIGGESGKQIKSSLVTPNGVKKWNSKLSTISPAGTGIDNLAQDAANLIDSNREFIQSEAFGYILEKFPALQNISYINPNITNETGRYRDASNLVRANKQEIVNTAWTNTVAAYPAISAKETEYKTNIGYLVDAIASDLYNGGNSSTVDATKTYFNNDGSLVSSLEITQRVFAFNATATLAKSALTNQLTVKNLTIIADPATGSNTSVNSCANVRTTVDNLTSILTTALNTLSLSNLPTRNPGPWSFVSETSKCRRDIGYILEAVASDLRLGGNTNVVDAAEAYFTGTQLDYIENEKTETLDAYNYVRDLAIAAMRNWSFTIVNASTTLNSPTVTVSSTVGIVIGMSVVSSNNNIPANAYVKRIINSTQFELGILNSRFTTGSTVNATSTNTTNTLTFTLNSGIWASTSNLLPVVDSSVLPDNSYPECAGVASAISTYFTTISTIINNGPNTVTKTPGVVNTNSLSARATLFTLTETGGNLPNPHNLETGTPVRLVPKPLNANVNKSLIRLPKEFDTNTQYYVIAPGRKTFPQDFSSYTQFDGSSASQRSVLLATSEENANAGIYIYSPETETVDPNVVIQVHQYVQDVNYDLVRLKTSISSGSNEVFETEGPHPFDLPSSNTTPQQVFFRGGSQTDITGSILPTKTSTFGGNILEDNKEYFVRLVPSTFDTSKLFVTSASSFAANDIVKVGSEYFKVTNITPSGTISLTVTRSLTSGINGSYASGDTVTKITVANSSPSVVKTVQELIDSSETVIALNNTTSISVGDYLKLTNNVDATTEFVKVVETNISDLDYDRLYVTLGTSFAANDIVKVDNEYFRVISVNTTGADFLTVVGAQINSASASHNNGATVTKQTVTDSTLIATSDEFIDATETIITAKYGSLNGVQYDGFSGFAAGDLIRITNNIDSTSEIVQIISFGSTTNIREAYVRRGQLGTTAVAQPSTSTTVITFTKVNIANSATTTTLNQSYPFTVNNSIRVERGQLGSAAVSQPSSATISATKQTLTATVTTTTLTADYPKLLESATNTKFTIHNTHLDAINGTNAVQFSNVGTQFYTYLNKRRSPIRFAPEAPTSDATGNKGSWYINTSTENNEILDRLKLSVYSDITGKSRTTDTWFYRTSDTRTDSDKIYRLRYVIPKTGNYREPINGFVLKIRTDDTRRLLPQRILLKPVGAASSFASITKNGETLGISATSTTYDPYSNPYTKETDSKINFSVQSARTKRIGVNDYLELTVFDIGVVDQALKTEILTTVKIDKPQGGSGVFNSNITTSTTTNAITWSSPTPALSSGSAYVHSYFSYENNYYMILKGITGTLSFSAFSNTTFTQGSVTAVLQETPDGGRSNRDVYKYTVEGANVYTMTVGDTITIPVSGGGNAQYTISSVEEVDDLEGTYYIFKSERIRRRIKGQQDGIYYLTCIRGDIRPNPTGSGIGNNFKNFKFSQPVSRIYPISTKNDPLWFQVTDEVVNSDSPPRDTTLVDPPQTYSAADNFIHGYVTVNDAKNSTTKEAVLDLIVDPGTKFNSFTGSNEIKALEGSASAGSESRKISIAGDSQYPTEKRLYVELRRPSIARSGNHTFEYLGFGPGNYSTGFPARQQVVLTDKQDYYAQAKRQDAGIVLYTGLNSSGDLYIGNKKINAITGEETLLDAPILEEKDEEVGISNALVTTFDDPVTFNNTVTFNYNKIIPENLSVVTLNVPITVTSDTTNTSGGVIKPPITVVSYSAPTSDIRNDPKNNGEGDITIGNNTIQFGVWSINTRGTQNYTIRTATTNVSPNIKLGTSGQQYYSTFQEIISGNQNWGNTPPRSGDILFKGDKVNYTGSLGWIYANDYEGITTTGLTPQVTSIQTFNTYSVIKVNFSTTLSALGINATSQVRIRTSGVDALNSYTSWNIPVTAINIDAVSAGGSAINLSSGYPGPSGNYIFLSIFPNQALSTATYYAGSNPPLGAQTLSVNTAFEVSNNIWKEVGVIGAEALRTQTTTLGDYRLGINTLARSSDTAYSRGFTDLTSENFIKPRANLDVVGNTFISGKTVAVSITGGVAAKTESNIDEALLVGGDSVTTTNTATLRVATTNSGRVGINVTRANLDRTLVVSGNGRITGDFRMEADAEINGGDLTSTASIFNLLNNSVNPTTTLSIGGYVTSASLFNSTTSNQTINIGNAVTGTHALNIANSATGVTTLGIYTSSTDSTINIGNGATIKSLITIGGAFAVPQNSILRVKNYQTVLDGSLEVNAGILQTNATGTSSNPLQLWTRNAAAVYVDAFTRAVQLNLGAVAGTTTIRNGLSINSDALFYSNITMSGGTLDGRLTIARGQLGTTGVLHNIGSINNLNVDYYRRIEEITGVTGIETWVDTGGVSTWSATNTILVVQTNQNGAGATPGTIQNPTTGTSPILGISIGDYLLVDNEIVQVVSPGPGRNPTTLVYEVPVQRGVDCTTAAVHNDNARIYKLEKTINATYLTTTVSNTATQVDLGRFGGVFEVNDYLRFDPGSTCPSGEFVRITAVDVTTSEKFIINDGAGGNNRLVVDSLCGGFESTLTGTCDFDIRLTTNDNVIRVSSDTSNTPELVISRDATITQVGDGTLAAPAAVYSGTGGAALTGDLLITSTNALDTALNNGRFKLTQSSGDLDLAGGIDLDGDISVYTGSTGINFTGTPTLQIIGSSGNLSTVGSITITNAGNEVFQANNDGSIDVAGIQKYFTSTGGRRSIYVTSGDTLKSNHTYLANLGSDTQFLLPAAPQTGDIIRLIDIGGTLTYSRSMIIRAQSGHSIQGDNTGSKAGGLSSSYTGGGELIVQTRNAAFGLVYVGASDTAGTLIPAASQGWWLMEI